MYTSITILFKLLIVKQVYIFPEFSLKQGGSGGSMTTHTSLSPILRGLAPSFVNYKKGCTGLAAASDKVYQLLAHGRWFSPGTQLQEFANLLWPCKINHNMFHSFHCLIQNLECGGICDHQINFL
jgi:hypothetical protein